MEYRRASPVGGRPVLIFCLCLLSFSWEDSQMNCGFSRRLMGSGMQVFMKAPELFLRCSSIHFKKHRVNPHMHISLIYLHGIPPGCARRRPASVRLSCMSLIILVWGCAGNSRVFAQTFGGLHAGFHGDSQIIFTMFLHSFQKTIGKSSHVYLSLIHI